VGHAPALQRLQRRYPGDFKVKIIDTYPGTKSQDVGIAELKARATSLEAF